MTYKRKPVYDPPKIGEDRSLVYQPIEGREQPPPHNGFVRDPDNPHKFHEFILPCELRRVQVTRRPACGSIQFHYYCKNEECKYDGKEVSAAKCNACPVRQLMGEVVPKSDKEPCEDCDDEVYPVEWDDDCTDCIERRKYLFEIYKKERERSGLPVHDVFGVMNK